MSRSCQSATFSSRGLGVAAQHAREAGDAARSMIGLRLWGIALEPFCRAAERLLGLARPRCAAGGGPRSRSARARRRRARSPAAARRGGRAATTCVETGSRSSPSRASTRARSRAPSRVGADRARDRADRHLRERPLQAAPRCGAASKAKPASLIPNVVGSACTPCVRPTQTVSACSRARSASAVDELARAGDDELAGRAQLQRERRVEHVGGRQPEVDPAPGRRRRSPAGRRRRRRRRGR